MRKSTEIVIDNDGGRDAGKVFVITEMPATQAEKWAMRALLALAKSGVELPDNPAGVGMASIATMGLQSLTKLSFADAEPLMDEMFRCVQIRPDPSKPFTRHLVEAGPNGEGADIEEITTRVRLRAEVLTLHLGFFQPGSTETTTSVRNHPASLTTKTLPARSRR